MKKCDWWLEQWNSEGKQGEGGKIEERTEERKVKNVTGDKSSGKMKGSKGREER